MKRILLMFMVMVGFIASAQEYQYVPIVREGVEWGYAAYKEPYYTVTPDSTYYYRLQFKGEVVFNDTVFHKLYRYDTAQLDTTKTKPYAFMCEIDKKVYTSLAEGHGYYDMFMADCFWSIPAVLIYDFNAKQGESFGYEEKVGGISTISVGGSLRNVFSIYGIMDYTVVEGIGVLGKESGNLPYPYVDFTACPCNIYHYLLYERNLDGTIVYKSPDYDDWISGDPTVTTDGIDGLKKKSSRLICEDRTIIIPDYIEGTPVVVYSADGNLVYQGAESHIKIQQPGIYVVKTATTAQKVMVK